MTPPTPPATADLYDAHGENLHVAMPLLRDYGGTRAFHGRIVTLRMHEDNSLMRPTLSTPPTTPDAGRVLVVDGGGSLYCALLGDNIAQLAVDHGWAGIIIHGCVRDTAILATMPLGIKALGSTPRKSRKEGRGEHNVVVAFAGVVFTPGHYLYADSDGIVVAPEPLT